MKKLLVCCGLLLALVTLSPQALRAGKFMSQARNSSSDSPYFGPRYAQEIPGAVGPYGQPVAVRGPSTVREPTGADYAKMFLAKQYPNEVLQQVGYTPDPGVNISNAAFSGNPRGGIIPTQGILSGAATNPNAPPPNMGIPGMAPPGPPAAVAALGALTGQPSPFGIARTEVRFVGPAGMKIAWYAPRTDGKAGFSTQYLEAPARYNFLQSSTYRLKLSDIPNRAGVDLYPTLQIEPANIKTATFLAHSAVPISFTEEDFEQVAAGNFVVKVIYLPDPQYQDLAATGPDEVVSSRLEPGVDPILEAKRRGTILAIIRLGNIDLEAPNTPAMDAPDMNMLRAYQQQMETYRQIMANMQRQQAAMGPNGMRPGMMPPGMMPPGMMPPGMMPPGMMPPGMAGAQPPTLMPMPMVRPGTGAPTVPTSPNFQGVPGNPPFPPIPGVQGGPNVPTPFTPNGSMVPVPFGPGGGNIPTPVGRATPAGNSIQTVGARPTMAELASQMVRTQK